MPFNVDHIRTLILQGIPDVTRLDIEDTRGDGRFISISLTTPRFNGLSRLDRHRAVYGCLLPVQDVFDSIYLTAHATEEAAHVVSAG